MRFKSRATGDVLYIADSQAKTIRHMVMSGRYEVLHNDEWNESDHPRGENGQFTGGGGSSGSMSKQEMEHNLDRYQKNIKWMESDPAYQHGRKLRELEEYRQGYRELRSQHEKEHGSKKEEPSGIDKKSFRTNNEGYGYHGIASKENKDPRDANQAYSAMAGRVEALTGASETEIRDYLDSTHGRHLEGHEDDMNYIKKDFKDFMKSYDPKEYE